MRTWDNQDEFDPKGEMILSEKFAGESGGWFGQEDGTFM